MGRPKQLLPLDGRPLLQHVVGAAAEVLDDVVLVLGHEAEAIAAALDLPPGCASSSTRTMSRARRRPCAPGWTTRPRAPARWPMLLGDQPEVRVDAIRAVVAAQGVSDAPILRAAYRGQGVAPRGSRARRLARRGGAARRRGRAALIAAHAGRVELVEVGGEPPEDIDTPEDLDAPDRPPRRVGAGTGAVGARRRGIRAPAPVRRAAGSTRWDPASVESSVT